VERYSPPPVGGTFLAAAGAWAWRWACRLIEPSDSPLILGPGQKMVERYSLLAAAAAAGEHAGSSSRRIRR